MLYLDARVKGTKINNTTGKAVVMKHKEYVTGVVTGVLAAALAAGGLNYVHQNQSGSIPDIIQRRNMRRRPQQQMALM